MYFSKIHIQIDKQLLYFVLFFAFTLIIISESKAQTKGLIIKPASESGRLILDPNNDGYISSDSNGFIENDEAESEIAFQPMIQLQDEPVGDLNTGPSCGFTDFVSDGDNYSSAYFTLVPFDGDTNLVFRFRMGNYAPNSKGYSVLIDSDGLFGNTGDFADPNYLPGNPGFEMEILLVTNHAVRLYDVDGITNPVLQTSLPVQDHSQISIAFTENCGTFDYFYDFFIPLSVIQNYFPGFNSSTPVRMVANSVINTHPALNGNISDINGIDDALYGNNIEQAWTDLITNSVAVSIEDASSGFPPLKSTAPFINAPINTTDNSFSGASSEVDGTVITIYINGTEAGTTSVSSGSWELSGVSGLAQGDSITATATSPEKSVSNISNLVIVGSVCSSVPSIDCSGRKGITGLGPDGAPTGTTIRIYGPNNPNTLLTTTTTDASNAWLYNCNGNANCNGGPNCMINGTYFVTAQLAGECESPKTVSVCINTTGTTATPVITTTTLIPASTSISGTATSGATVYLFKDGYLSGSTTATGGNWTFSDIEVSSGQIISVRAYVNNNCFSSAVAITVLEEVTKAPQVNYPVTTGTTTVSGSLSEEAGSEIYLYINGILTGSTTVNGYGNWSISGLSPLSVNDEIHATALANQKSISVISNIVIVSGISPAPEVTGAYAEGDTEVTGTSTSPDGTIIYVYIDGFFLDSTIVSGGSWTLSGLSEAYYDLYAGGEITATAKEAGLAESIHSNGVIVDCAMPVTSLILNVIGDSTCLNAHAQIELLNSQSLVIYTIMDSGSENVKGSSVLGTGSDIILATVRLSETETFTVEALKLPQTSCRNLLSNTATVNVMLPPDTSNIAVGDYLWLGNIGDSIWSGENNWVIWDGSSFELTKTPPGENNNVIIKKTQECIHNLPEVTTDASADLPAICNHITIEEDAILSIENTVGERALTVKGNWNNYGTFIPNAGTVFFNGNTVQTIFNNSGTENFHNLVIEGNSTVVELLSDVSTSETGIFTLNDAKLDLGEHKFTVFNNDIDAVVHSGSGHVLSESQDGSGAFLRSIETATGEDYIFPLGNASGHYIPVIINLNSGNIGIVGVSSYKAIDLSDSTYWPQGAEKVDKMPNPHKRVPRHWYLSSDQPSGTYNVNVNFGFRQNEVPPAGANNISMIRYNKNDEDWDYPLPVQSFIKGNLKSVFVQGITGFSWWGGEENATTLPVELKAFTSICQNDENLINWITYLEIDNEKFHLYRSYDGLKFELIAELEGAGNSLTQNYYSYLDYESKGKLAYYKLVQYDFDGSSETFNVITANCNENMQSVVKWQMFPNPASEKIAFLDLDRDYQLTIFNNIGNVILHSQINIENNTIDVSELNAGIYIVMLENDEEKSYRKLVIR